MKTRAERLAERATLETWTGEALALAQRAGEFVMRHELRGGIPLYVLPTSWIPSTHNLSVGGQSCRHYDVFYRPVIEQRTTWHGRGPCVTVNNIEIYKTCPRRELFVRVFVALALHECCHAIQLDAPFRVADEVPQETIDLIESWQPEKHIPIHLQPDIEPWLFHEPLTFGRILISLAERINGSGLIDFKIPLRSMYGHKLYGVSPLSDYATAFDERLADVPLSHLFLHEIPPEATQLFNRDKSAWQLARVNNSAGITE